MGRPKGSKNKPKDAVPTAPATPAVQKKPAKEVKPAKAAAKPEPKPEVKAAPAKETKAPKAPKVVAPVASPAVPAAVARTEDAPKPEPTVAASTPSRPPEYTLEDLQHDALAPWEAAIKPIVAKAAAHRKLFYEEKSLPGVSLDRRVLKTLIDYLEIDVKALIAKA